MSHNPAWLLKFSIQSKLALMGCKLWVKARTGDSIGVGSQQRHKRNPQTSVLLSHSVTSEMTCLAPPQRFLRGTRSATLCNSSTFNCQNRAWTVLRSASESVAHYTHFFCLQRARRCSAQHDFGLQLVGVPNEASYSCSHVETTELVSEVSGSNDAPRRYLCPLVERAPLNLQSRKSSHTSVHSDLLTSSPFFHIHTFDVPRLAAFSTVLNSRSFTLKCQSGGH